MTPATKLYRHFSVPVAETARRLLYPQAHAFYTKLLETGYLPNVLIDVLSDHEIIYVCIPKCASARIKKTFSGLLGRQIQSSEEAWKRKQSGLKSPKCVGLQTFWQLSMAPRTLRFAFVRNPYSRLVSLWAHQFRDQPLIPGKSSMDAYLTWRTRVDASLPEGADESLSFEQFVHFTTATANGRADPHWERQVNIIDMPGIILDLVGKIESFSDDFNHVLDHLRASAALRCQAVQPFNMSEHHSYSIYYTSELANLVFRAYEEDFDRFRYVRTINAE